MDGQIGNNKMQTGPVNMSFTGQFLTYNIERKCKNVRT